jgi:hypothetical protein
MKFESTHFNLCDIILANAQKMDRLKDIEKERQREKERREKERHGLSVQGGKRSSS